MKPRHVLVKVAVVLWVIGLTGILTMFCIPPWGVPAVLGLAAIAVIPAVFGSRPYQVFGTAAVLASLFFAYWQHEAGLRRPRCREAAPEQPMLSGEPK